MCVVHMLSRARPRPEFLRPHVVPENRVDPKPNRPSKSGEEMLLRCLEKVRFWCFFEGKDAFVPAWAGGREAAGAPRLENLLLLVVRDQKLKSHSDPWRHLPDTSLFFDLGLSGGAAESPSGLTIHPPPSLDIHSRSRAVSAATYHLCLETQKPPVSHLTCARTSVLSPPPLWCLAHLCDRWYFYRVVGWDSFSLLEVLALA